MNRIASIAMFTCVALLLARPITAQDTPFNIEVNPADGSYAVRGSGLTSPVLQAGIAVKVDGRWIRSSDYPQHKLSKSRVTDELGAARRVTVTHTGLNDAPDLVCIFNVRPEQLFGDIEVRVENHQNKPITVQAIRPLQAIGSRMVDLGGPLDADRVLSDSFSEDRPAIQIRDLIETPPAEMHRAVGSQLIYNRKSGRSLFIGALGANRLLTIIRLHLGSNGPQAAIQGYEVDSTGTTELLKENSLEDSSPEDQIDLSLTVQSGQSLASEKVLVSVSADYHAQLESYGSIIRKLHHPRVPAVTLMGWWSWTAYYSGLNQDTALTNAQWLALHLKSKGYDFFHMDEGYAYARGEYTTPDADYFPDGISALEQKVCELGLTPGIWTAPFQVSERSRVYLDHKDWLVHNAKGEPIHAGKATDNRDSLFVLDTTHPGAQAYMRETYRKLVKEWNIHYIKLDFMDDGAVEGYRYKPNTTALEAQRIGLQIIRETVGDHVLLDKDGSTMLAPVGLVDTGRISLDTGHSFDALKDPAPGIAARYYMNHNFYLSDPDAFSVSKQIVLDRSWHGGTRPLTLDEAKAFIALAATAGGMFEIGDDLPTLGAEPDRLALVENQDLINMIRLGRASRPLDLMTYSPEDGQPSVSFLVEDRRQSILTVFNWTENPRTRQFNFDSLGLNGKGPFQILDVFEPGVTVPNSNGLFEIDVQPHSARVLKIVDTSIPPGAPLIAVNVPGAAATGKAVQMSAQASTNGVPALSYRWDFGDGTSEKGPSVTHAYTQAGDYKVRLIVEGMDDIPAEATASISVKGAIDTTFNPKGKRRLE